MIRYREITYILKVIKNKKMLPTKSQMREAKTEIDLKSETLESIY
jgi:hypothetical protein